MNEYKNYADYTFESEPKEYYFDLVASDWNNASKLD